MKYLAAFSTLHSWHRELQLCGHEILMSRYNAKCSPEVNEFDTGRSD